MLAANSRIVTRDLLVVLVAVGLRAQSPASDLSTRHPQEYAFFRAHFQARNGTGHKAEMDIAFGEIAEAVERIRRCSPRVTLGGMLSLVIFESGARLAFYNTRDAENSFAKRLNPALPYWQQPFARYSYQFGLVPIHTSVLRPCMPGTQPARALFDRLAKNAGFAPNVQDLAAIRPEFQEVCGKVLKGRVADQPRAADYYILNSHRAFHVPNNASGGDLANVGKFPFYSAAVTTPLFFREIEAGCRGDRDDRQAICVWGGGDGSYCKAERQDQILGVWLTFTRKQSRSIAPGGESPKW